MNDNELLNRIRDFADHAHGEQLRKYTPERYIVHPVRVMKLLQERTSDTAILAAALLHDVLEDTSTRKEDIRKFLNTLMDAPITERTLKLVIELTDIYTKEAYPQRNRRKRKTMELQRISKTSSDAQTIKYADIIDNCKEIAEHDRDFARVFLSECRNLLKAMDKGDRDLYIKAQDVVKQGIKKLKKKAV